MSELRITFGTGDPGYTILDGTIRPTDGQDGANDPCLEGAAYPNNARKARIRVDLPSRSIIQSGSLGYNKGGGPGLPAGGSAYANLYDAQDNLVGRAVSFDVFCSGNDVWHTPPTHQTMCSTPSSMPVPDVSYVIFGIESSVEALLDNCALTFAAMPEGNGETSCPCSHHGEPSVNRSVGVRSGEKREQVTDLALNTPAGSLAFARGFRQSKLGVMTSLGKGWTHNHLVALTIQTTFLILRTDNGSEIIFLVKSTDYFQADPGSTSFIRRDSGTGQYTLTAEDKSLWLFDSNGKLLSRTWPNGESLMYTYSGDKLVEVGDVYGNTLKFAYINNPGQYNHDKLWRVGDTSAAGLDTTTPSGRYVEFGYVSEKLDGQVVTNPGALLAIVQDVRGNTWTYDYYGQDAGEDDAGQQSFLTEYRSPLVDLDGDGAPDDALVREALAYTMSGGVVNTLAQQRGFIAGQNPNTALLSTSYAFQPGGQNRTDETTANQTTVHHFDGKTYVGAEDPAGNTTYQAFDAQFRPEMQTDPNDNQTLLTWSADGRRLEAVQDALDNTTAFNYHSDDTLRESIDAAGQKTRYIYADPVIRRQPTTILRPQDDGLAVNGGMELDSGWPSVGGPQTNERSQAQVDTENYARYLNATTSGQGIEGNAWDLVAAHPYLVTARVYVVTGSVRMHVTGTAAFDQTASPVTPPRWQTLCALHTPASGAAGVKLQFLSEGGPAEFYVDSVSIDDMTSALAWQEFVYDSKGRTLNEKALDPTSGATVQETTRSYYTSGNGAGLLHTLTQKDIGGANDVTTTYSYDSAGRVVKTQRSSNFGECDIAYTVYDAAGNVVASLCNYDPGTNPDPTNAAEAVALFNPADPDTNRVTTHEYDTLGRRFQTTVHAGASYAQTTLTVLDALDRVVRTIGAYVADASVPGPFTASRSAFDHGADQTQNLVTDSAYNARGMLRQQTDVLGNVTLLGYDDAGRLVKTVQNASQPGYNNDYGGVNPDPSLASYAAGGNPDADLFTTRQYDPAGNLVKAVDALGSAAFTVYDALNRPVKTVHSAKTAATVDLEPGEAGYDAANDPRSVDYVLSADPDRDLVDLTTYDALGRVVETKRLLENRPAAQWVVTRQVNDALGRQVKSITNYVAQGTSDPAAWLWDAVDRRWEDGSGNAIDHGAANDQNLITDTVYDAQGRVLFTRNLKGECTWSAYDGLGRQVKTIANAVGTATDGGANDPRSESYTPSAAPDRDLVSHTTYDADGRVRWTQDPVGRKTWYVYDTLGRQTKVIRNCSYVTGTPAPEDENYVGSTDPDKDRTTRTVYDSQGRVWKTIDERGNETRHAYDALGRRTTTIANYVDGVYNPAFPDEDRIQTTTYDLAGRVVSVIDVAGTETQYEYDAAGRRTRTISNCVDGLYDSDFPDEDLIQTTTYNKGGQVTATADVRGAQTAFAYDAAGRQRQATSAADSPQASSDYICYDKAGRRLRAIQNYRPEPTDPSPDARDAQGDWLFAPAAHGLLDDANRIMTFTLDKLGRVMATSDPLGNGQDTAYARDGAVQAVTDPEGVAAQYRSDRLGRRALVVQGYTPAGTDPAQWVWDATDGRWEDQ